MLVKKLQVGSGCFFGDDSRMLPIQTVFNHMDATMNYSGKDEKYSIFNGRKTK